MDESSKPSSKKPQGPGQKTNQNLILFAENYFHIMKSPSKVDFFFLYQSDDQTNRRKFFLRKQNKKKKEKKGKGTDAYSHGSTIEEEMFT